MLFNHNMVLSRRIFFNGGNKRKYITGGWKTLAQTEYQAATAEIGETIYLEGKYVARTTSSGVARTYNTAIASTEKKIDVTNLSKICFAVTNITTTMPENANSSVNGECVVGVADDQGLAYVANKMHNLTAAYAEITEKGTVTVDVSELTGEYFIYASATGGYYMASSMQGVQEYSINPNFEISKIWAE